MKKEYRPNYYKLPSGKDLIWYLEHGFVSKADLRGFYKVCILKYWVRYPYKGQRNNDLKKLTTYAQRLKELDTEVNHD